MLIQFFQLATFFWMALEGLVLYRIVMLPFASQTSVVGKRTKLKYVAIGWGRFYRISFVLFVLIDI